MNILDWILLNLAKNKKDIWRIARARKSYKLSMVNHGYVVKTEKNVCSHRLGIALALCQMHEEKPDILIIGVLLAVLWILFFVFKIFDLF